MIPRFNSKGFLPPGIHPTTLKEFESRFNFSRQRSLLISGLKEVIYCLRQSKCKRLYIDGSFVTSKLIPNDYDACWEESGVDLITLKLIAPELFETRFPRKSQKARFKGELFPSMAIADEYGNNFIDFFQQVRDTTIKKGIIEIKL